MTIRALIVGLGQIGMGYDLALDPDTYVLTHARAFQRHPAFELLGAVDPDAGRRQLFEHHYGLKAFTNVASAMRQLRPDLVAIASPTPFHAQCVNEVLQADLSPALLCEKPLTSELSVAKELVATCEARGVPLYVNYIRRSEPGAVEVRRRLEIGAIAVPVKGIAWYSKGIFNNGSHFVNLLQDWLGDVTSARLLRRGRNWTGTDPEPDFVLNFLHGQVYFLAAREEYFSHYTVELLAPNGRLRYEQGGETISWQGTTADPAYPGYTVLAATCESIVTSFARTQWHVADELAHALSGRQARICTGTEALRTLESIHSLLIDS